MCVYVHQLSKLSQSTKTLTWQITQKWTGILSSDKSLLLKLFAGEHGQSSCSNIWWLVRGPNLDPSNVSVPAVLVVWQHRQLQHERADWSVWRVTQPYVHPAWWFRQLQLFHLRQVIGVVTDSYGDSDAHRSVVRTVSHEKHSMHTAYVCWHVVHLSSLIMLIVIVYH